ncbi:MAG: hypothetical protein SGILL_008465, partial [Bacillariaceae sp.]
MKLALSSSLLLLAASTNSVTGAGSLRATNTRRKAELSECADFLDFLVVYEGEDYRCDWYAQDQNCAAFGIDYDEDGVTANEACCACGGGARFEEQNDNEEEEQEQEDEEEGGDSCTDMPDWVFYVDGWGYTCDWYAQFENCQDHGLDETNGVTAIEACCACHELLHLLEEPALITEEDEWGEPEWEKLEPEEEAIAEQESMSLCTFGYDSSKNYNPIAVPDHLLPNVNPADVSPEDRICERVDFSSMTPPPNPGFRSDTEFVYVSSDDLWKKSYYMMVYASCERQVRGIDPFTMFTGEQMVLMQENYQYKAGHDDADDRFAIAGGEPAEGAGGGPLIGAWNGDWAIFDTNDDGLWDAMESGRRDASFLLDHGTSMIDPKMTRVFATTTV